MWSRLNGHDLYVADTRDHREMVADRFVGVSRLDVIEMGAHSYSETVGTLSSIRYIAFGTEFNVVHMDCVAV